MNTRHQLFLTAALGLALARTAWADPTAFAVAKKGDEYVGIQSKDKVVRLESEKSVASLTPNIWHVEFYDPDTPFRCVDIKFGAGQEMDVSHPIRPFQLPTKEDQILAPAKLKVDSDQALKIAAAQPLLKSLTLKASKLTLDQGDIGPVWKVQLWAAKLNHPSREADIGTVTLSATDGTVVRSDLHPGRVD